MVKLYGCVLAAILASSCSSSSEDELTRSRCEQLRDHVIDLRLADAQVDREAHRAAMKRALGDGFVSACLQKMTVPQVRCALAAPDTETANTCSPSASAQTASK